MKPRLREHLAFLKAYDPTRSLEALAEEAGVGEAGAIKLDGNENPYGPSPRARRALARYPYYHFYPDPYQRHLRQALASYVGLGEEYIVAGAGSDELIDLVLRVFLEPGDQVLNLTPTFGMYRFCTQVCGGQVVEVPRDEGFAIDLAEIRRALGPRTRVVFVASPNNPSGNPAPEETVRELLDLGIMVVVDEAYYEFYGHSLARLVSKYENLVVLRTFSKWAGLAGLRVGYGVFPPPLAETLLKVKSPYNVNVAASVAALASLEDREYLQGNIQRLLRERERLFRGLQGLGLDPWPSQANFILCRVPQARQVWQALRSRGVFVRYFDTPRLKDCLRISVGKPQHTRAVLQALREMVHG